MKDNDEKEDRMRERERESTKYLNFVYALGRKREIDHISSFYLTSNL